MLITDCAHPCFHSPPRVVIRVFVSFSQFEAPYYTGKVKDWRTSIAFFKSYDHLGYTIFAVPKEVIYSQALKIISSDNDVSSFFIDLNKKFKELLQHS